MAEADGVMRLVTAELRCAFLRAKSAALEIQQISDLLEWHAISPIDALMAIEQLGWGGLMHADLHDLVKKATAPKADRSGGKK